ncbi:MAG TPA: response regulator, partial [Bacteroidia bacterium]|nr:response regulator [Bacteroidia bacterium]
MERKILIVEDEPKVAGFIRSGLSESSLASDWAADGESGIAMLEANNYDLLILDL